MGFSDLLAVADRDVTLLLGDEVTYTPGDGDPVDVFGVFDDAYILTDLHDPGVSSTSPAIFFRLEDLPTNPETDTDCTVTVGATTYRAHTQKPDGKGGILLLLHVT